MSIFYKVILISYLLNFNHAIKRIAVVEYQSIDDQSLSPDEILSRNSDEYIKIMENLTSKYSLFVVVFPEGTLDNVQTSQDLPYYGIDITKKNIPCSDNNSPDFLTKLSCATKQYQCAIVINLIEVENNQYYSSDVVLDTNGQIAFSIRREHRIGIKALSHPPIPFAIPVRFIIYLREVINKIMYLFRFASTSFVTGFSFSFEKIISLEDDRLYLVSSNWISELPFLTSLQMHQMWAQEFNITVCFSGKSSPKDGQGGTGVYDGGPPLYDILPFGGTKAYVYDINYPDYITFENVDQLSQEMDNFNLQVDPDLERYEHQVLNYSIPQTTITVCYDKIKENYFCCDFSIKISWNKQAMKENYIYHLVAYRGLKNYHDLFDPGGIEICAIVACLDENLSSCGRRFNNYSEVNWSVKFESIVIKARFGIPKKEKIYFSSQFPNSLLSSIRPIQPNFTKWSQEIISENGNKFLERTFELLQPQDRVLTFGIFGRNFTLFNPKPQASSDKNTPYFYNYFIVMLTVLCVL